MAEEALRPGLAAEREFTVDGADTATALGSGSVPVLATPRLLAWAEAVTVAAVDGVLAAADTSVGTGVQLQHLRGTPVGGTVHVRAELDEVDGRTLRFGVSATDGPGRTVLWGTITRVVVDRASFLDRL